MKPMTPESPLTEPNDPAVSLVNVHTRFGDKIIHDRVNLTLARGEILALVGASGSGKTTLFREIIGLQRPSGGEIRLFGRSLETIQAEDPRYLLKNCGVLFQKGALFTVLNVFDNIAFPLRESGIRDAGLIEHLVFLKLAMVGLEASVAWLKPSDLSGGMVKRVALARSLILEPPLLLLDEPTSGLDPVASEEFVSLLGDAHRDSAFTVALVTHDLHVLKDLCTLIAVLADRQVVAFGPLAEVLAGSHPFIRDYFHNRRAQRVFQEPERAHG